MPNKQPNYVWNCDWDCIEKVQSRSITIIDLYRKIFGNSSIPEGKQYWTMCGAHFNEYGFIKGELGHITESGLIQEDQFNGVDREEVIIKINRILSPIAKWYHGDFLETMEDQINFNPAIINYDGVMQPKYGTRYLKTILKFIDFNVEDELLLTSNFLLTNPYTWNDKYIFSIDDTIRELSSIYWFPNHWLIVPQAYVYGKGKGYSSQMGMIMFVKKKHKIDGGVSITKNRKICV
jgi:hypothetical protein